MSNRNAVKMKAYKVTDKQCACGYSTIIFAETREKARAIALWSDAFDWFGLSYLDFWVKRVPALDKYYRGKSEMEWDDPDDRIAMVKEAGFICSYEYDPTELECKQCPAKQWCERYEVAE